MPNPEHTPNVLQGTTGIITGAGGALGRAMTLRLVSEGVHVVAVDRDAALLAALAEECPRGTVTEHQADLLSEGWGSRVAQAAIDIGQPVAVWINNAGVAGNGPSESIEDDFWDRVMSLNVRAVMQGSRAAHSLMAPVGHGSIINISSLVAKKVLVRRAAYGTSKVAVEGLTRYLAAEWGEIGIRVNAIAPGFILTPISHLANADEATLRGVIDGIPMRRLGTPDDIASAAVMLASPESSYMTGQVLQVDGGWSLV